MLLCHADIFYESPFPSNTLNIFFVQRVFKKKI